MCCIQIKTDSTQNNELQWNRSKIKPFHSLKKNLPAHVVVTQTAGCFLRDAVSMFSLV